MSFTQDELQAFNTILDRKLSLHRRELERSFEQRIQVLQHTYEQRLKSIQQATMGHSPRYQPQQQDLSTLLNQKLEAHQTHIIKTIHHDIEAQQQQHAQQLERLIENTLATQFLALEQLLKQHASTQVVEPPILSVTDITEPHAKMEAIEIQTEISWDDFIGVVDKALAERFSSLHDSMQAIMKNMQAYLATQVSNMRDDLIHEQAAVPHSTLTNVDDVFRSIEQLERIIESMQVAMTANHALLSNRLYHHLQLPPERAHTHQQALPSSNNNHSDAGNHLLFQKIRESTTNGESYG